jgi:hypothetical protein
MSRLPGKANHSNGTTGTKDAKAELAIDLLAFLLTPVTRPIDFCRYCVLEQ